MARVSRTPTSCLSRAHGAQDVAQVQRSAGAAGPRGPGTRFCSVLFDFWDGASDRTEIRIQTAKS